MPAQLIPFPDESDYDHLATDPFYDPWQPHVLHLPLAEPTCQPDDLDPDYYRHQADHEAEDRRTRQANAQ